MLCSKSSGLQGQEESEREREIERDRDREIERNKRERERNKREREREIEKEGKRREEEEQFSLKFSQLLQSNQSSEDQAVRQAQMIVLKVPGRKNEKKLSKRKLMKCLLDVKGALSRYSVIFCATLLWGKRMAAVHLSKRSALNKCSACRLS